jgi:zinc/manganese transport system ATP-binding protein
VPDASLVQRPGPKDAAIRGASIGLSDVTIAYDRHPIVHHLSGAFAAGSLTAIVGPNGAGKSTLLKAIAGLLPLRSGCVDIDESARRSLAYLPQAAEVDRNFPLSIVEVVDFGHWRGAGAFGRIDRHCRRRSEEALATVGLSGMEATPIRHLSMGQLQRVLFARLIVQDGAVVLLDEPFNGVDARTTEQLLAIIAKWRDEARTVIAALHDLEQVKRAFPRTLVMAREMVAWGDTASVLSEANLLRAAMLARTWSDPASICRHVA